jgi:hypothetical protein
MIRLAEVASVGHDLVVELLAKQPVIGDAGKPDHLSIERLAGILKPGIAG